MLRDLPVGQDEGYTFMIAHLLYDCQGSFLPRVSHSGSPETVDARPSYRSQPWQSRRARWMIPIWMCRRCPGLDRLWTGRASPCPRSLRTCAAETPALSATSRQANGAKNRALHRLAGNRISGMMGHAVGMGRQVQPKDDAVRQQDRDR